MRTLGVIEVEPFIDNPFSYEAVGQFMQIESFVLERAPWPLNEDIVHAPSSALHGDCDLCALEHTGEVIAGEDDLLIDRRSHCWLKLGPGWSRLIIALRIPRLIA